MTSCFFVTAWMALVITAGFAQSPAAANQTADAPSFEVATIKPGNPKTRDSGFSINDDNVEFTNTPLTLLLQFAYSLSSGSTDQIIGGPPWIGSARFDINAKEDAQLAARLSKMPREERIATLRQMVQTLLAERFQLKVHHETRDLRVLALTVAKGGSKLTETKPDSQKGSGLQSRRGEIEGWGATMKMLVDALSPKPEIGGRLMVDATGLAGKYDFDLKWSQQTLGSPAGDDAGGPSLFAALQEQLGLKPEDRKAPVDCIVIDHVEMPSKD